MSKIEFSGPTLEAFASSHSVPAETREETAALVNSGDAVFAVRNCQAPWHEDAQDSIVRLLTLGKNWDSYGADAVKEASVRKALHLATRLSWIVNVERPSITATAEGNVGFSWDTGDWSLDAAIDGSGLISYVFLDERDSANEREGRTRNIRELIALATNW